MLPKLYGVYDNADQINIDELPEKFVIKTNHGCGNIFICTDKKTFDVEKMRTSINACLKQNYAEFALEYHYAAIEPKVICEEYLCDGSGKSIRPLDYKFYCFDGKPECILYCSERDKDLRLDYYDLNWNYLDYSVEEYKSHKKAEKPQNLDEMTRIASDLSRGIPFVRVDLYNINGKIYFGELTFTPCGGLNNHITQEALDYFGSLIKLPPRKR